MRARSERLKARSQKKEVIQLNDYKWLIEIIIFFLILIFIDKHILNEQYLNCYEALDFENISIHNFIIMKEFNNNLLQKKTANLLHYCTRIGILNISIQFKRISNCFFVKPFDLNNAPDMLFFDYKSSHLTIKVAA